MANCTPPDISQLTNNQQLVTPTEAATLAVAEIATQLGIALTFGDSILPLAPFVWLAVGIEFAIDLLGGGRPKDQDTLAVIQAYNMSAFEPLHALATNLQIALNNGAPISDSRANIQAQFSAWKQGTIESIQQQAGLTPGPSSPGYWQLQQLINTSWVYSKAGEQAVLTIVEAIDCFTEVLAQIAQTLGPSGGGLGGQPGGDGGPGSGLPAGPCPPLLALPNCLNPPPALDPSNDEFGNAVNLLVYYVNIIAVYLMNILAKTGEQTPAPSANPDPVTCAQLTGLIGQLVTAIGQINISIPPGAALDLTPIVQALDAIRAALTTAPGPLTTPTIDVPTIPPAPRYTPVDFANDLEAAKEQLLGETQVFGA